MAPLPKIMQPWHDVFMLFGTASATLIGLLFVAASVASNVPHDHKHAGLRSFWSPSVVIFSCVLVAGLIAISPLQSWTLFGILICGDGLFGIIYSLSVLHRMVRSGLTAAIDLEDRLLYAALPAISYVIMTSAGATLVFHSETGCDILAIAMGLLLLVGIRNAWDITIWTVMRRAN